MVMAVMRVGVSDRDGDGYHFVMVMAIVKMT